MGVFNKAIPKYTGNIYNEVVVEPVEEQPTFVDDIFDPILNKAVRDRLMSQYGNPIGATLGGYAELINSSIMGNRHQGGNTLPGLGILTSFGRSMDKAGDVILGSLTETVKGVTGQGVESPFYNIFTEDEDYSGQRLLAASANSMAKLAGAPELTEADFGGVWTIPALGIDLATDPSILGSGLTKIANGTGAVADMGRLLQDYDDLMAKVAIDVTAPGVRPLAKKVGAHVSSLISNHRSEQGLTDQIIYLKNILKRAEMAYGDGSMPKEQFDTIMSDIAERIQKLNDAMAKDITDVNLSKIKTDTDEIIARNDFPQSPPITSFRNENSFLSNMYDSPLTIDGVTYKNAEAAFQSLKLTNPEERTIFSELDGVSAKKLGKTVKLRPDWDNYKLEAMEKVLRAKFEQNPYLMSMLKNTGTADLIEGNDWGDVFWGMSNGRGENRLGSILKKLRSEYSNTGDTDLNKLASNLNNVKENAVFRDSIKTQGVGIRHKLDTHSNAIGEILSYLDREIPIPEIPEIDYVKIYQEDPDQMFKDIGVLFRDVVYGTPVNVDGRLAEEFTDSFKSEYYDNAILERLPQDFISKYDIKDRSALLNLIRSDLTPEAKSDIQKAFKEFHTERQFRDKKLTLTQSFSKLSPDIQVAVNHAEQETVAALVGKAMDLGLIKDPSLESLSNLFDELWTRTTRYYTRGNVATAKVDRAYNAVQALNHYRFNKPALREILTARIENIFESIPTKLTLENFVNKISFDIDQAVQRFEQETKFLNDADIIDFLKTEIIPGTKIHYGDIANDFLIKENRGEIPYTKVHRFENLLSDRPSEAHKSFSEFYKLYNKAQSISKNGIAKGAVSSGKGSLSINIPTVRRYPELYYTNDVQNQGFKQKLLKSLTQEQALTEKYEEFLEYFSEKMYTFEENVGSIIGARLPDPSFIGKSTSENTTNLVQNLNSILSRMDFEDPLDLWNFLHRKYATSHGSFSLADLGFEPSHLPKNIYDMLLNDTTEGFTKIVKYNGTETSLENLITDRLRKSGYELGYHLKEWNLDEKAISKYIISEDDYVKYFQDEVNIPWREFVTRIKRTNTRPILRHSVKKMSEHLETVFKDIKNLAKNAKTRQEIYDIVRNTLGDTVNESVLNRAILQHNLSRIDKTGTQFLRKYSTLNSSLEALKTLILKEQFIDSVSHTYPQHIVDKARKLSIFEGVPEGATVSTKLAIGKIVDIFGNYDHEQLFKNLMSPSTYSKNWFGNYVSVKTAPEQMYTSRFTNDYAKIMPDETYRGYLEKGYLSRDDYVDYAIGTFKGTGKINYPDISTFKNRYGVANKYSEIVDLRPKSPKFKDNIIEDEMATMFTNDDIANVVTGKVNLFEEADLTAKVKLLNDMFPDKTPLTELDLKMYFDTDGGKNPIIRYIEENHPEQIRFLDLVAREFKLSSLSKQDRNAILSLPEVEELLESAKTFNETPGLTKNKKRRLFTILDKQRGSVVKGEDFLTDLLFANGIKLMAFDTKREMKLADTLRQAIEANIKIINDAVGKPVIELVDQIDNMRVVGYRMVGSQKDWKKVGKLFNKLHFNDIVFEAPKNLTTAELKFLETTGAGAVDVLERTQRLASDYYRKLGYDYNDPGYFKHTFKNTDDFQKHVGREYYKGIDIDTSESLADMVLSLDYLGDFRGTYNVLPNSRTFEGNISRYGDMFSTELDTVVKGTFTKGIFANEKFQTTMSIFTNKEFKIGTYFKNVEDLKTILNSEGNIRNLTLAVPKYSDDGVLVGFTKFDNYSDYSLSKALENPDTVFIPTHIFATLDKACKHKARMSNKLYAFVNRYITAPFKVGILLNPGFLLGNMNDAYLKQASTMAKKYGTSVAQELANVAVAIRSVMYLNNTFGDIYDKYLKFMADSGVELGADFKIPTQVANSKTVRDTFIEFLNKHPEALTEEENNIARAWIYLNILQPTEGVTQELLGDVGKLNYARNGFDRLLYGLRNYKNTKPQTWGLLNTPPTKALFKTSESIESTMRAASILNDLRHQGLDLNAIGKELRIPHGSEFEIKMLNAINAMHNANFDYNATSPVLDAIDGFVPFPTFWLKNISYWFDMFMNHPQYIDHALSVNEGLWANEDTSEDEFKADAKARGAIPMSAVSEQKLSNFFKGIYKPSPLQSMFTAFNAMENPIENLTQRVHPLLQGAGVATESMLKPYNLTTNLYDPEDVRYRPYNTDQYQPNIKLNDPNFNPLAYTAHKLNPFDRTINTGLRTPGKIKRGEAQLSDFFPSVFQPDFGKK